MPDNVPWYEQTKLDDRPIPLDDHPELEPVGLATRSVGGPLAGRRSEYTELAELAAAAGPRDEKRLLQAAHRIGELLGKRAFYSFPTGDSTVSGPTIDLMDALAVAWGRVVSRVSILDSSGGRVHLRGHVIDLLTLTAVERDYVSALAPAPGKFAAKPDQAARWETMQLQSASSKAIRGALEHALPAWLVDEALRAARWSAAQAVTEGKALPEVRAKAVELFAGEWKITREELEAWTQAPVELWTTAELGELRDLAAGLKAGEVAVEHVRNVAALRKAGGQVADRVAAATGTATATTPEKPKTKAAAKPKPPKASTTATTPTPTPTPEPTKDGPTDEDEVPPVLPPAPEPWTGPTGSRLIDACTELEQRVGDSAAKWITDALSLELGAPVADTPEEEAYFRRYLVALRHSASTAKP